MRRIQLAARQRQQAESAASTDQEALTGAEPTEETTPNGPPQGEGQAGGQGDAGEGA